MTRYKQLNGCSGSHKLHKGVKEDYTLSQDALENAGWALQCQPTKREGLLRRKQQNRDCMLLGWKGTVKWTMH